MTEGNTVTIGQIARGGAFLRAARLIREKRDYWYIMENLRREWFTATDLQLHTIIRLAERGVEAADQMLALGEGGVLPESAIPKIPR
jgi:hypothetical protein